MMNRNPLRPTENQMAARARIAAAAVAEGAAKVRGKEEEEVLVVYHSRDVSEFRCSSSPR